jgi:hypothetical protein
MYRAIISLTEVDAVKLGYDNPQKWRELTKRQMPEICDKIGISSANLNYAAAVHMEKGHPHVHLLFWDEKQEVKKRAFVPLKIANGIRIGMIKDIFSDEMSEFQKIKNEARSAALSGLNSFFDGFAAEFASMTPQEYAKAVERLKRDGELAGGKLIYNHFKTANIRDIAADLLKICDSVSKRGRLNYKFTPSETKSEIDSFIRKILSQNEDCRREFNAYLNTAEELAKFYSDNPDSHAKARQNAEDDMMSRIGNVVLRAVKKLNSEEREKDFELKSQAYRRQAVEHLITEIFRVLSQFSEAEDEKLFHTTRMGELSKQAKKELALELENSNGYDWER